VAWLLTVSARNAARVAVMDRVLLVVHYVVAPARQHRRGQLFGNVMPAIFFPAW
jgi:hypothetical protein